MTTFGATLEDVKSLLPHLRIGEPATDEGPTGLEVGEAQPSEADVMRFLGQIGNRVRQRVGDIPPESPTKPGEDNPAYLAAQELVVLGAASRTEAAAFPERAEVADSSYAWVLWTQFKEGLDELLESLGVGTGGGSGSADTDPDRLGPLYSFPEDPIFRRLNRY